jgi:hypothetical protein
MLLCNPGTFVAEHFTNRRYKDNMTSGMIDVKASNIYLCKRKKKKTPVP